MEYTKQLLSKKRTFNKQIEQSDIGIVTPYKLQCKTIAGKLRKSKLTEITVGSAEVFQGQERPIMILSTVRSGGTSLGFVSEPRVSDALWFFSETVQSLMIFYYLSAIECDDHTSQMFIDHCWKYEDIGFRSQLEKTD